MSRLSRNYRMKRQHIIVAPPASGKSYLSSMVSNLIDSDITLESITGDRYIKDPEIYENGSKLNLELKRVIQRQIDDGHSVISNLDLAKLGFEVTMSFAYNVDEYFDHCHEVGRDDVPQWGLTPEEIMIIYSNTEILEAGTMLREHLLAIGLLNL